MTIPINVYGEGVGSNIRIINAADKREFVRGPAGGNPADGNHILVASKTGIANIEIVGNEIWIGTRSSAHGNNVASVNIVFQRERAHSGIVVTVVVIYQGGCSKGAVPCARGVEQKSCGAHCRVGI